MKQNFIWGPERWLTGRVACLGSMMPWVQSATSPPITTRVSEFPQRQLELTQILSPSTKPKIKPELLQMPHLIS